MFVLFRVVLIDIHVIIIIIQLVNTETNSQRSCIFCLSLSLSLSLFSRSSLSIKLKVSHDTAKIHYRFVSLVGAEGTKEISVCDACLPAETDPSSFLRLHTASPKVGRREHSLKTIEPLTDDVRAVESAVAAWTVA